jgi:hypothetical protein
MTPLEAQLRDDGYVPQEDDLLSELQRSGLAPEAGYDEGGPVALPCPETPAAGPGYAGWPPVLQWEIDPADAALESGDAVVTLGDWEYAVWWQRHPAGLVYAALHAVRDDSADGPARQHPVGRGVVVNLVYDERRLAVVAIYGTARDFRPFVEAFCRALKLDGRSPNEVEEGAP